MQKKFNYKDKDKEQQANMSWCLKNGIRIYFEPQSKAFGKIVIEDNGIISYSEEDYKGDNTILRKKRVKGDKSIRMIYSDRIFELYTIKYLENNEK